MPVLEGSRYLDQNVLFEAKKGGLEFEPKAVDRIVVTGFALRLPLVELKRHGVDCY